MARVRDGKGIYESTEGSSREIEKSAETEAAEEQIEEEEENEKEMDDENEDIDLEEESEEEGEEVEKHDAEDEDGKDDSEESDAESNEVSDDDFEGQPLVVEKMFFEAEEYVKACKIGTRCRVTETVGYIESFENEVKWFHNHSQFKHVFHMYREPNHMTQGMWMLLLRTAMTAIDKECWFVVNGVPIRYSMKEHALLTGFSCHEYPKSYSKNCKGKTWDLKFVNRVFGREGGIKVADVEEKLKEMKKKNMDRKKMVVLYFLCKIVDANSKTTKNIDSFLLSIVDDLTACEEFPWGRYTFEKCLDGIKGVMRNMKGKVKPKAQIGFSGFIVPLEILAFECIPRLRRSFRVDVPADKECPRMCKSRFNDNCNMKGIPLEDINERLGRTKDISSILTPDSSEKRLLARILGDEGDYIDIGIGFIEPIVDSWREHLQKGKKIWFKSLYDLDVGVRTERVLEDVGRQCEVTENEQPENEVHASQRVLKEVMDEGFERFKKEVFDKLDVIDARVTSLENQIRSQKGGTEETEQEQKEREEKEKEQKERDEKEKAEREEMEKAEKQREEMEKAEKQREEMEEMEKAAKEREELEEMEKAAKEREELEEMEKAAKEREELEEKEKMNPTVKKKKEKKIDETVTLIPTGEKRSTRHRPKLCVSPWGKGRKRQRK